MRIGKSLLLSFVAWLGLAGAAHAQAVGNFSAIRLGPVATPIVFTRGTGTPTGGADGDIYVREATTNTQLWQNINGTWERLPQLSAANTWTAAQTITSADLTITAGFGVVVGATRTVAFTSASQTAINTDLRVGATASTFDVGLAIRASADGAGITLRESYAGNATLFTVVQNVSDGAGATLHLDNGTGATLFSATSNAADPDRVLLVGAGTNNHRIRFSNTGGEAYIGQEGSAGGEIMAGTSAYAFVLRATGTTRNLELGANNIRRLVIDPASFTSIIGISGSYALQVANTAAAGSSFGLTIEAGGNSSDTSFQVRDRTSGNTYFRVRGDGPVGFWGAVVNSSGAYTPGSHGIVTNYGVGNRAVYEMSTGQADGLVGIGALVFTLPTNTGGAAEKRLALVEADATGATANQRGGELKFYTKPNASGVFNITTMNNVGAWNFGSGAITTTGVVTFANLGGSGVRCVEVDNAGLLTVDANACNTSVASVDLANNVYVTGQDTGMTPRNLIGMNTSNQVALSIAGFPTVVGGDLLVGSVTDTTAEFHVNTDESTTADGTLTIGGTTQIMAWMKGVPVSALPANASYATFRIGQITVNEAPSGNHPFIITMGLDPPSVSASTATVSDTATLWLSGAATGIVSGVNYALYVDDGPTRLDGSLQTNGPVDLRINNNFIRGRETGDTQRDLLGIDASNIVVVGNTTNATAVLGGHVGVGTTTPNYGSGLAGRALTVYGGAANVMGKLELVGHEAIGGDTEIGRLSFHNTAAVAADKQVSYIAASRTNDNDAGQLDFFTYNASGTIQWALRFRDDGETDARKSIRVAGNLVYSMATPTITSGFGTGPTITGKASSFKVTAGTGSITTGVVAFNATFANAPSCSANDETTANLMQTVSTTTQVTVNGTIVAGDVIKVSCLGF